jgi:hypothetical protein
VQGLSHHEALWCFQAMGYNWWIQQLYSPPTSVVFGSHVTL